MVKRNGDIQINSVTIQVIYRYKTCCVLYSSDAKKGVTEESSEGEGDDEMSSSDYDRYVK